MRQNGSAGPVTSWYRCPQDFATVEVPDEADIGWDDAGGQWAKGAELVAAESATNGLAIKRDALPGKIDALRTWAADEADKVSDPAKWDAWTTAQKFAALKVHITREAQVWENLADLIETRR